MPNNAVEQQRRWCTLITPHMVTRTLYQNLYIPHTYQHARRHTEPLTANLAISSDIASIHSYCLGTARYQISMLIIQYNTRQITGVQLIYGKSKFYRDSSVMLRCLPALQYPACLSTTLIRCSLLMYCLAFSTNSSIASYWKVSILSAQWGLSSTLSRVNNGLSSGSGSFSQTSNAAPRIRPCCNAVCTSTIRLSLQVGNTHHNPRQAMTINPQ